MWKVNRICLLVSASFEIEAELFMIGHMLESKALKIILYQLSGNVFLERLGIYFFYNWPHNYSRDNV